MAVLVTGLTALASPAHAAPEWDGLTPEQVYAELVQQGADRPQLTGPADGAILPDRDERDADAGNTATHDLVGEQSLLMGDPGDGPSTAGIQPNPYGCYATALVYRHGLQIEGDGLVHCRVIVDSVHNRLTVTRDRWYGEQTLGEVSHTTKLSKDSATFYNWYCNHAGTYTYHAYSYGKVTEAGKVYVGTAGDSDRNYC